MSKHKGTLTDKKTLLKISSRLGNQINYLTRYYLDNIPDNLSTAITKYKTYYIIDVKDPTIRLAVYDALCHITSTVFGTGAMQVRIASKKTIKHIKLLNGLDNNTISFKSAKGSSHKKSKSNKSKSKKRKK